MAPASEGEALAREEEPSSTINHADAASAVVAREAVDDAGDDLIALGHLQRARTQGREY
jgi:hypothetical protein